MNQSQVMQQTKQKTNESNGHSVVPSMVTSTIHVAGDKLGAVAS